MKRVITILLLSLATLASTTSYAAIDPRYKEAMQRGYSIQGDSVEFPDGVRCQIDDFNAGRCGVTYRVGDYCVKEGLPVWDEGKCCEGLEAWLADDEDGQASCQKSSTVFWLKLGSNPITWAAGGLLVGALLFTLVRRRRGMSR